MKERKECGKFIAYVLPKILLILSICRNTLR